MTIDKLEPREKILLAITLILAITFVFHTYIYQPKVEEAESLNEELATQLNDLEREVALLSEKKRLEARYENITEQLEEKSAAYLDQEEPDDILLTLNQLIVDKNLDLLNMQPGSIIEDDIYNIYPVSLSLEGSYEEILAYVIAIEELDSLIIIEQLEIEAVGDSLIKLAVAIDLEAYLLADESGDLR